MTRSLTTDGRVAPVRLGVVGLGAASAWVAPVAASLPEVAVVAGADPSAEARARFGHTGATTYADVHELASSSDVDAVYVASPTPLHVEHVLSCLAAGKHVVVEKPMAASVAEAATLVEAADRAGRVLVVGHSQSFEAPVRAMRAIIESQVLGALRAISCVYYTDWMYRPRHPDELDAAKGGGVTLRQGAHHVDIIRFLGGGELRSVRGRVGVWDARRRADGAYSAYLEFEDGTPATAVYSGYDRFPSSELTFGIGEGGQLQDTEYARARRRLAGVDTAAAELAVKRGVGGLSRQAEILRGGDKQPFFGLIVVSCERADLRVSPDGLLVYGDTSRDEIPLGDLPVGRVQLLTELVAAVRGAAAPTHDGRWGLANLEVCEALMESSALRREVMLSRQVALVPQADLPAVVARAAQGASTPSELR